jgi:hypothetical protein
VHHAEGKRCHSCELEGLQGVSGRSSLERHFRPPGPGPANDIVRNAAGAASESPVPVPAVSQKLHIAASSNPALELLLQEGVRGPGSRKGGERGCARGQGRKDRTPEGRSGQDTRCVVRGPELRRPYHRLDGLQACLGGLYYRQSGGGQRPGRALPQGQGLEAAPQQAGPEAFLALEGSEACVEPESLYLEEPPQPS